MRPISSMIIESDMIKHNITQTFVRPIASMVKESDMIKHNGHMYPDLCEANSINDYRE